MQEKDTLAKEIEQIIALYWDTAKWTNWMELAAAEIVALIEGKVIWEEDEITVKDGWVWFSDTKRRELRKALEKLPDGQRVRVIVEDIDESRA